MVNKPLFIVVGGKCALLSWACYWFEVGPKTTKDDQQQQQFGRFDQCGKPKTINLPWMDDFFNHPMMVRLGMVYYWILCDKPKGQKRFSNSPEIDGFFPSRFHDFP
jgi:hypothetical protein